MSVLCLWAGVAHAHPQSLREYYDRGHALSKAGKHDQALPYFLLALELAEQEFGPRSPETVSLLDALAEIYTDRGDYGDAEPLLNRSLEIQERSVTRYQRGVARTLNGLAGIYEATGRLDAAVAAYQRVIKIGRAALEGDDPNVRNAQARLAELEGRKLAAVAEEPAAKAPPEPAPPEPAPPEPAPPEPAPPKPAPTVAAPPKLAPATPAVKAPPKLAPATPPPPQLAFWAHLTSIRNPDRAEEEWIRLRRVYPGLLADKRLLVARVDLGAKRGIFHRIQAGPMAKAAARALCATVSKRGAWCGVTGPAAPPAPGARAVPARPATVAEAVPAPPPQKPGFRVHLTSVRKAGDAQAEWARLKRLHAGLLGGLELFVKRADLGPARGTWYRIQAGPLGKAAARTLCATFAKQDIWCRVVRPAETAAEHLQRLAYLRSRRSPNTPVRRTRGPARRNKSLDPAPRDETDLLAARRFAAGAGISREPRRRR